MKKHQGRHMKRKLYSSSFKPNSISFCWNHELTTFFTRVKLTLLKQNTLQKLDFIRSDEGWNSEVLGFFKQVKRYDHTKV